VLTAATFLWFMLLSWPGLRRIGWSVTLVTAAAVQYFMLHYGIVDPSMVRNALQTNTSETMALMGSGLLLHVLLYAGLPMVLWAGVRLQPGAWRRDLWRSALLVLAGFGVVGLGAKLLYKPMAPLVRNHTEIRLINPLSTVVSVQRHAQAAVQVQASVPAHQRRRRPGRQLHPTPEARHGGWRRSGPQTALLVLVVGDRALDHFGLNGYPRNTTPEMEARHVISWRNVRSCGTNTLASVPCMFSHLGKEGFEGRKFEYENLLDVLQPLCAWTGWTTRPGAKGCATAFRTPRRTRSPVLQP
jgi:lipid A ethanolaminephosphotransferase